MIGDVAAHAQQGLHGEPLVPPPAWSGGLGVSAASWPGNLPTGSMGAMVGSVEGSLYSQLAAAQREGRPPLPGRATNRLSAPADLQQQLRAFAAGQPISRPAAGMHPLMGGPPAGGGSTFPPCSADLGVRQPARAHPAVSNNPFVPFSAEQHASAAWAPQHSQVLPCQRSFYGAGTRPQYDGTAGAFHSPGMPSTAANITDYAASLIGFSSQPPAPGSYPGAVAVGLQAMETGLGLGGSGLATNSVPLLPRAPGSAGSGALLNPFQGVEDGGAAWPSLAPGPASHSRHPQHLTSLPYLGRSVSTPNAAAGQHFRLPPTPSLRPGRHSSWHEGVQTTAPAGAAKAAGGRPKVGRPRKYDLSADAGSSGGESSGTGDRGCSGASKQEALARRRERNRASALEAYYRGKARRTELESQLLELKEEDAALRALAAMIELDSGAAVRIRQMLSAGIAAMEVTRRLRCGQQTSEGRTYQ